MAEYYFAGASLPMLLYESKVAPISIEDFISIIEGSLSVKDQQKVLAICLNDPKNPTELSPLGVAYWQKEKNLRNELVRLRAAANQVDPKSYWVEPENDPYVVEVAESAFRATSPYEAEVILDDWRWKRLCELETGHFYDVDFFTAYYIKLQILIRKSEFSVEKGNEQFKQIYQSVLAGSSDKTGEIK